MLKFAFLCIVFGICGFTCEHKEPEPKVQLVSEETLPVEVNDAYKAEIIKDTNWKLTINARHFAGAAAISVHYNDTYYGVFLPTDTVYLPVLLVPEVELILTTLDADNNPMESETFRLKRGS